ncbi:TRAP transporter large permease [uncultured Castellaniella sp.]|uniref:TRAP transporter large permease n=1 Tax=uncultured Castellaniella sp. TaxID=647907 RepID=UPI00261C7394|nr:TRAP transporter large permease [uncultured Castellaniella sp.]
MEIIILGVIFIGAVLLSVDIGIAMLIGSASLLLIEPLVPLTVIAQKAVTQVSLFPLLAIPGFILTGELMNVVGMTKNLGEAAQFLVGRLRGGLGYSTIIACMVFGGMTGSGLAETVAIGSLMVPLLAAHGYPKSFSSAMIAAGGSLGPVIPPSIPMVIYASIAPTVSITSLFISGIVPGLMLGIGFLIVVGWRSRKIESLRAGSPVQPQQAAGGRVLWRSLPAFGVPVIIFYLIFGGYSTVTEASVAAAVYVVCYGVIVRKLSVGALFNALKSSLFACGIFGFIIAAAGPFSFLMSLFQAPEAIGAYLTSISSGNTVVLMLLVTVVLLGLGTLVEATSLVIILAPILAGVATVAGINQLHMACVSIVALMIGLFTPPVGTNLFAMVGVSGASIESISKELLPFIVIAVIVVLVLAVFPASVTFLPDLLRS